MLRLEVKMGAFGRGEGVLGMRVRKIYILDLLTNYLAGLGSLEHLIMLWPCVWEAWRSLTQPSGLNMFCHFQA